MSLSAPHFSASGALPGNPPAADWGDSLYGSLAALGPRKMKKKPVLVLDEQELARAHMAIAMGGAEIMESADMEPAPRVPQPATMLGLAPMGRDEAVDDAQLYPPQAFAPSAGDDEGEEPDFTDPGAEEEGAAFDHPGMAAWPDMPAAAGEDEDAFEEPGEAPAPLPSYSLDHLLGAARGRPLVEATGDMDDDEDDAVPSIAEQLQRMRERTARPAPPAAPAPLSAAVAPLPQVAATPLVIPAPLQAAAPPVTLRADPVPEEREPQVPPPASTIERLEIDDWTQITPLRAIVPPAAGASTAPPPSAGERALPHEPAAPPAPPPAMSPVAAPIPAAPAPAVRADEDPVGEDWSEDAWDQDEWDSPEWPQEPASDQPAEPALFAAMARRTSPAPSSGLDALPRRLDERPSPSALRARIRETQAAQSQPASPSLLARLVRWVQGLLGR